jgi:hypothetical protein
VVNAKVTEVRLPDYIPLFGGKYNDFSVEWYRVVGSTIVLTMIIQIVTPHIGFVIEMIKKSVARCWDRGCTCNKRRTKKWLQADYDEVYRGPEFLIEVRYS